MQFDAIEFKNTQQKLKEMIEINNKNSKNGVWKWNEIALAAMFIEDAIKNNGDRAAVIENKAYWIAIRLKFTTPEIDNLIIGYLNGERNYTYELYGMPIYDWMRNFGCPYPEAILNAYFETLTRKELQEYGYYYPVYPRWGTLRNTKLLEDGKTIVLRELYPETDDEIQSRRERNKKSKEIILEIYAMKEGMTIKEYKKLAFGDENHEVNVSWIK